MSIQSITPEHARKLLDAGAMLIDVREADEHAREHIPQAHHVPLASIGQAPLQTHGSSTVIFHCLAGARTHANADKLASSVDCNAYVLEGGLNAWKRAGLPVVTDRRQPLELMRQVQIAAGLLVLTGVVLGAMVTPAFYALSGFVGAGLTFAGATGTCGMARVLQLMPWNRRGA